MNTPSHACLSAGLTLLALAACQPAHQVEETSPAAVPNEMSVTTKQQFREKVVGKQLTSKNGNATIHDDGSFRRRCTQRIMDLGGPIFLQNSDDRHAGFRSRLSRCRSVGRHGDAHEEEGEREPHGLEDRAWVVGLKVPTAGHLDRRRSHES